MSGALILICHARKMTINSESELFEMAVGACGAIIAEVLHWHRIARRGRWPKYAKSLRYWFITFLVVLAGGVVTAAVSTPGSSLLQLLLLGVAGPQLLHSAARSHATTGPDKGVYLGSETDTLRGFL